MVSGSNNRANLATAAAACSPFPAYSLQGRLRCTQHTILCTALQVHT